MNDYVSTSVTMLQMVRLGYYNLGLSRDFLIAKREYFG